jgi:hypothetical protein
MMVRLGEPVLDAMLAADTVEHVQSVAGRWATAILQPSSSATARVLRWRKRKDPGGKALGRLDC